MSTESTGLALSIIGFTGIPVQIFLYPAIHARLDTLPCYRLFASLFPIAYALAPFVALLPIHQTALIWAMLALILLIHTIARTFTLPATIMLLNSCTPHTSVLGAVHGAGQSVSAAFRTLGSVIGGFWFAWSLQRGIVWLAWWAVAVEAVVGWLLLWSVRDGVAR
jgi:hypothetical protein